MRDVAAMFSLGLSEAFGPDPARGAEPIPAKSRSTKN